MIKKNYKVTQKAEEDSPRDRDYTSWQREQHEKKSKPFIQKIKEKLIGEEDRKGPTPDVGPIKIPTKREWSEAKSFADKISKKKTQLMKSEEKSDDDMLVYPEEFKMGMKEELEHADVIGKDKESLKKIVLTHLKENPHYYTKLHTVMKAEEERRQSSMRRSMKHVPHEKDIIRHLPVIDPVKKEAEEGKNFPLKEKYNRKPESVHYITPDAPKYKKAEEEDQISDYIKSLSTRKMTPGWKAPKGPKPKTESDLPSERLSAEEGLFDKVKSTVKDLTTSPKVAPYQKPEPLTKKGVRGMYRRIYGANEVDYDSLNELYLFMKWMTDKGFKADDKEKLEQHINQYNIEKFAEEKQDPAKFHAEPEKAEEEKGLVDSIKSTVKDLTSSPRPKEYKPLPPLTKKTMTNVVRKIKSGI